MHKWDNDNRERKIFEISNELYYDKSGKYTINRNIEKNLNYKVWIEISTGQIENEQTAAPDGIEIELHAALNNVGIVKITDILDDLIQQWWDTERPN